MVDITNCDVIKNLVVTLIKLLKKIYVQAKPCSLHCSFLTSKSDAPEIQCTIL